MSFFFPGSRKAPTKKTGPSKGPIPIHTLRQLGCKVCPHDKRADELEAPKMEPSGKAKGVVYLLGSAPSQADDKANLHWSDAAGDAIWQAFGSYFMKAEVRSNYIQQCAGEMSKASLECCRNRIIADIEETRPGIIVTVGDAPLEWATGINAGALRQRGQLIATKIGNRACWVYPIIYPKFAAKKNKRRKSEHELTFNHDIRTIKRLVEDGTVLTPPVIYESGYADGIELITGQETGDLQRLEKALHELRWVPDLAIDIETNGLRPKKLRKPEIYIISIGNFERVVSFTLDHPEGWGTETRRARVRALVLEFIINSGVKTAHNLAMELEWLASDLGEDLLWRAEWDDTMLMAHTLDERPGTKSLNHQIRIHAGFELKAISNIDVERILEYPLTQTLTYCGMDSKWTSWLRRHLRRAFEMADNVAALWREHNRKVRLAPALVATELKGLAVDMKMARQLDDQYSEETRRIEAKIRGTDEVLRFERRFGTFSPTSPDHVLQLLRDICKRDEVKLTAYDGTTSESTSEEVLESIPSAEVPSASLILEHRAIAKVHGTYIKPIITGAMLGVDGLIHSKYSTTTAETGRQSSEDPNAQNFPKRKHREVRRVIVPHSPDYVMAPCDYGQIEFRVIGMASEDENIIKYCWTGYDVHKWWAERMISKYRRIVDHIVTVWAEDFKKARAGGKDEEALIIKLWRQEAKNKWVFPMFFGSQVASCAAQLNYPLEILEELADDFWDEFRGVRKWQDKLVSNYERNLYVETLNGRRRRGALSRNQIINHPIQGTAGDIVGDAQARLAERSYREEDPCLQMILNVHDDLTFELPANNWKPYLDDIAAEMCRPVFDWIQVPLLVEASIGPNWADCKEVQVYRSNEIYNLRNPYA